MWRPLASRNALVARSQMLADLRGFLAARGVIEVQTPVLGEATVTDPDVDGITAGPRHLQTSPEYFMKRLLAAGYPDCYQLGPVFRNDETGSLHNPEFTMLEWYRLGFDHRDLMREVGDLVDTVLGEQPYSQVSYEALVGGDLDRPRAELDLAIAEATAALRGRVFVCDYPAPQAALARLDPEDPSVAARFELVVDGVEIANGYWELEDADEHRRRFLEDNRIRRARGLPERDLDERFLAALEAGLPDCAGVALGVDRLLMQKLGARRIEEVIAFRH